MNSRPLPEPCRVVLIAWIALAGATWLAAVEPPPPDIADVRFECPIRWAERHQVIDGFGASAAFHQAENLQTYPAEEQRKVLDLLFSQTDGAGLSIVRNIVGDGGEIGEGKFWGEVRNGPTPSIEPREGVWNWTGDEGQIWFMREAAKRGATRYLSTAWSPPAWMKTNQSVINGGHLRRDKYQAYAEYLAAYVRGYREHHGIEIDAISPQNEPDIATDYSSCLWTGEEFHDFLKQALIPVFQRERIKARLVLGEQTYWTDALVLPSLRDPEVAPHVDVVAAHAYTGSNLADLPIISRSGVFQTAKRLGKTTWLTEVASFDPEDPRIGEGLYWAKVIHAHLVQGNASAWFYWWALSYLPDKGSLILLDLPRKTWTVGKRLYAIGNYARFIRPGSYRVGAESNPAPGVLVSAFVDPTANHRIIVAVNDNSVNCQLLFPKLAEAGDRVSAYRTSASEDLVPVQVPGPDAEDLAVNLPGLSVTTFVLSR